MGIAIDAVVFHVGSFSDGPFEGCSDTSGLTVLTLAYSWCRIALLER